MNEGAPIPYKAIDDLTKTLSARDSLTNTAIQALRGRFPGPIHGEEKRLAAFLVEELATQAENLSLEELEERWYREEKERKVADMKNAIGESIPLVKKEEMDFEDLIDETELTPEQAEDFRAVALSGITDAEKLLMAKWMLKQASITNMTFEELAKKWEEERVRIADDDKQKGISSKPKEHTVTTGKQEGAGIVNLGLERPEERGL